MLEVVVEVEEEALDEEADAGVTEASIEIISIIITMEVEVAVETVTQNAQCAS